MAGDLILQSQPYPIQGNTNKALSYRAARDIFLSCKESFQMDTSIDMNNKTSHEAVTKDQLDGALVIVNTYLGNKANKSYVDSEIAKIPTINTSDYIKKDGSVAMADDLMLEETISPM